MRAPLHRLLNTAGLTLLMTVAGMMGSSLTVSRLAVAAGPQDRLAATTGNSLRLTLPPQIVAVEGFEMGIYFDNIVLSERPQDYRFSVECPAGQVEQRRWALTAKPAEVGEHPLTVTVSDSAGVKVATAATTLRVLPANLQAGKSFRLLIVGDSLTHASAYPNEVARLFSPPANPKCTLLGTHRPASAAAGVAHEGYGGWTWQRFVSKYEPQPDGTYRKRSSPFVFLDATQQPGLDVKRYITESCANDPPDIVVFMLGINDCFSANPDELAATDERISAMFVHTDKLISAFRQAAPHAHLGICLTTPPNSRQAAFQNNYQDRYSRWGWKRIQHRLVERQLQHFAAHKDEHLFVIPTQLYLDPIDGYPPGNGVHPNGVGYQQIGRTIHANLMAKLTETNRE